MIHPPERPELASEWEPDVLGAPYLAETIALTPDDEGVVECHLVLSAAPQPTGRAVLYVHGFCDYFFQTEFAQWWVDRGYDFYAVDLRKYGRSLRQHQTAGYVEDVGEYFEDLDEVWQRITGRDGHDEIVLAAHSTGGLTLALWADARRDSLGELVVGMVLNSPWVDMHGPFLRRLATRVIKQLGRYQPRREVGRTINPTYAAALHTDWQGEWTYNLAWKPAESWPVYVGWIRAIRRAHDRLHQGLQVPAPVLVLTSGATGRPDHLEEDVWNRDVVLDVAQMRRWATAIGRRVTCVSIDGAMHDVVLSGPQVRARVYHELDRWHRAYVAESDPVTAADPVAID